MPSATETEATGAQEQIEDLKRKIAEVLTQGYMCGNGKRYVFELDNSRVGKLGRHSTREMTHVFANLANYTCTFTFSF